MSRRLISTVFLSVVAALVLLSACATPPPKQTFPDLTWTYLPPFKLDVAKIEVVSKYEPPFKAPNVEHLMPVPPEAALRRWITDRIKAAGTKGFAKVIIKKASVVEVPLKVKKGIKGIFTDQQAQRYDASVEVTIEIWDGRGNREGYVTAAAKRSRTVPQDITLNERERVWFEITEGLMKNFNAEMDRSIRTYLSRFLL